MIFVKWEIILRFSSLISFVFFHYSIVNAKIPQWAKENSIRKNGDILLVVCNGEGPSVESSRNNALNSCKLSGSQFLSKTFKVKSISIQTEKSVGLHEEISERFEVKNLDCLPKRSEISEVISGTIVTWLQCEFDLKKAIAKEINNNYPDDSNTQKSNELNEENFDTPSEINDELIESITIMTIPNCDTILVVGKLSRTLKCKANPVLIELMSGDKQLIIRTSKYRPVTLSVSKQNVGRTIKVILNHE